MQKASDRCVACRRQNSGIGCAKIKKLKLVASETATSFRTTLPLARCPGQKTPSGGDREECTGKRRSLEAGRAMKKASSGAGERASE
eukprot:5994740-Pleurochrysis_carterae.AAC.1